MIVLKSVQYNGNGWFEATWVDRTTAMEDVVVTVDGEKVVQQQEVTKDVEVRSHNYAGCQTQDFRDDLAQYGGNEADHAAVIAQAEAEYVVVVPPVPKVTSVTMRQARLALLQTGHLDAINTAIEAAGPAAKIEWDYATEVARNWPLVAQLQPALGMSDEDIDNLFSLASTL